MILVADFMWKYVPTKELYKKFMIEGKKWDNDFTMQCLDKKAYKNCGYNMLPWEIDAAGYASKVVKYFKNKSWQ